jgi:hypothetical protein
VITHAKRLTTALAKEEKNMTNKTNKIKKAVLGLIAGAAMAVNVNASNPADLTSNNRECPVQFYKVLASNSSNWACGIVPFGKNKEYSACGLVLQTLNKDSFLEGVIANHAILGNGIGLDTSLDVSKFGNYDLETKVTLDLSNKSCGIGAIIPVENTESSQIGARANYKGIEAYVMTSVKTFDPMLGLTAKTKLATVDAAYTPSTSNAELRISKAYSISKGTFIPEVRVSGSGKISNLAIALAYIPGGK